MRIQGETGVRPQACEVAANSKTTRLFKIPGNKARMFMKTKDNDKKLKSRELENPRRDRSAPIGLRGGRQLENYSTIQNSREQSQNVYENKGQ